MASETENEPGPGAVSRLRYDLRAAAGMRGKLSVLKLLAAARLGEAPRPPVPIWMSALDGHPVYCRPGTTDFHNIAAYLGSGAHEPPEPLTDPRWIVELGTNMGAVLTALGYAYPTANLAGVEPDSGNIATARMNLRRFGPRAQLVEAAIWDRSEDLVVDPEIQTGEHGLAVRPARIEDPVALERFRGISIDEFLALTVPDGERVDYMHVTIEGSEPRVFAAGGEWPSRVESMRVEVHPYFGYLIDDCVSQLEKLGYRAYPAPRPPGKWVFAVRA